MQDKEEIYSIMAEAEQKTVRVVTTDGMTYSGYIDVFESRSDNGEDDEPFKGVGSIILVTGDNSGVCLFEYEIVAIEIIG